MKKLILLYLILCSCSFAQYDRQNIMNKVSLKGRIILPDSLQLEMYVKTIIQLYGEAFKYSNELRTQQFKFDLVPTGDCAIIILRDGKPAGRIPAKRLKNSLGDYLLTIDEDALLKFVDRGKLGIWSPCRMSTVSIVERNEILHDERIIPIDDLDPYDQRLLDRKFMMDNFVDQNDNRSVLFKIAQAGIFLPYPNAHSKLLVVDNGFHSVLFFDQGWQSGTGEPLNGFYGYWGDDPGEFMNPPGISVGRKYENGSNDVYPIFIADMWNARVGRVNYIADRNNQGLGYFDPSSWIDRYPIVFAYDVAYLKNRWNINNDKLWVSSVNPDAPSYIRCYFGDVGATEAQNFLGYKDGSGQLYRFDEGSRMRLDVFPSYNAVLVFVDNVRNNLVACQLNQDGTATSAESTDWGDYVQASEILHFPDDYRINSVHFHSSSEEISGSLKPPQWPYLWVTSDYYIHCLKLRSGGKMEYLASTRLPSNSLEYFGNLMNTISTYGTFDIYTIEKWDDSHGIRKYYPSADVHSNYLEDSCAAEDSTHMLKWKAVLTNDCWIKFSAARLAPGGTWEPVKIKKFNGGDVNDWTFITLQPGGRNQEPDAPECNFELDLPFENYILGGQVKIIAKIFPEYFPECDDGQRHVHVEDTVSITKFCPPVQKGGCPFLYVLNDDSLYQVDNNILHRWEFTDDGSIDIRDLYKLLVEPTIFDGYIMLSIAEHESDHSYLDYIKLHAVDYPDGSVLGVTEYNDIVLYDPSTVISSDTALLNGSEITSLIQYNNPIGVNSVIDDSIYAHFPILFAAELSKIQKKESISDKVTDKKRRQGKSTDAFSGTGDSLAIIALVGNLDTLIPHSNKYWAGNLTAMDIFSNETERQFARREKLSEVIIPLFSSLLLPTYIDHIGLKIQNDSRINYLAAVSVSYPSLNMNEATLDAATRITLSGTSDVLSSLQSIDQSYADIDSASMLTLKLKAGSLPPIPSGYKRAYLIEVVGHYDVNNPSAKNANLVIDNIPLTNQLYHNYPNPFNPLTKIKFDIRKDNFVKIRVYNILGQEVKTLVNEFRKSGRYIVEFDGINLASGVYFYRIEAGDFVDAKKMILVK